MPPYLGLRKSNENQIRAHAFNLKRKYVQIQTINQSQPSLRLMPVFRQRFLKLFILNCPRSETSAKDSTQVHTPSTNLGPSKTSISTTGVVESSYNEMLATEHETVTNMMTSGVATEKNDQHTQSYQGSIR